MEVPFEPDIEDFPQLIPYLRAQGMVAAREEVTCTRLPGGVSNKTVRVARQGHPNLVVKQALPKLRVPVAWFSDPARIHREYAGLRLFGSVLPGQVPDALFQDRGRNIIAMSEVPSRYVNWKSQLLRGEASIPLWRQFGGMLGRIHAVAPAQLADVDRDLWDRSFFHALRLEPYYQYTAEQVPAAKSFLTELVVETLRHQTALVHGDYSPKNILVHGHSMYLLDFEVCHVGDPGFDLGFALTHALSKAHHLHHLRQDMAQAAIEFWAGYRASSPGGLMGEGFEPRCVRHTLACLLARVRGRSPLEYLNRRQQSIQERASLELMANPPSTIPQLAGSFLARLESPGS